MDQFTAHLDRGWDLISRGDLAGAMLSAQKGLELDANSPEAHNLMGYVQAAEGNAEEALEHYRIAVDLDDTFIEAMLNAAEVLIHPMRDLDGALSCVEEALDLLEEGDERADAMLLKVDILLHAGDPEGAAQVVAALPEGPFESPGLDFLVGRARFDLGDLDGAEPRIRRAAKEDPENPESQYYLGLLCEARGDLRGATIAFLQARELDMATGPVPWTLPVDQFEKRVQVAIDRLPSRLNVALDGALIVVSDLPGAEVVADGVDPRMPILLEELSVESGEPRVGRVFVYQRNVERGASGLLTVEDELVRVFESELEALFPPSDAEGAAPEKSG